MSYHSAQSTPLVELNHPGAGYIHICCLIYHARAQKSGFESRGDKFSSFGMASYAGIIGTQSPVKLIPTPKPSCTKGNILLQILWLLFSRHHGCHLRAKTISVLINPDICHVWRWPYFLIWFQESHRYNEHLSIIYCWQCLRYWSLELPKTSCHHGLITMPVVSFPAEDELGHIAFQAQLGENICTHTTPQDSK